MLRGARDCLAGWAMLFAATAACSSDRHVEPVPTVAPEVGIIDLPASTYELNHAQLTSSPARMFYS